MWLPFLFEVIPTYITANLHTYSQSSTSSKQFVICLPDVPCDMSYVGETGQTLQLRIKEHRRALTNGDPCMSALAEHAINHHHNIAWEDATVVDADPHMYRRRTLEAWHIRQEPKPMNRDRGLLPPVYDSLIRTNPPSDSFM